MCFVLSNNFAISASGEQIILKNISAKEESEEADEFHDSQKCLRQSSSKKFSKKNFMDFVCFSNLSARFLIFFNVYLTCVFYCFGIGVKKEEI